MQLKGGFLSFPQITFAIFTVYSTKTTHVSLSIPKHIYMIIARLPAEHTALKQTLNLCPGFNKTAHWLSPILFTPSNVSPDTFYRAVTFNSRSRLNPPYPEQNGLSLSPAGGALAAFTCTRFNTWLLWSASLEPCRRFHRRDGFMFASRSIERSKETALT